MESDIMPLPSSSPPPLDDSGGGGGGGDDDDDDDDGGVGSEEDEFGDFGGFSVVVSCSPIGFSHSTEPPSSLSQPSSTTKPAPHQPCCTINQTIEQSQPASILNSGSSKSQIDEKGQGDNAGTSLHLENEFSEIGHISGTHYSASVEVASSSKEEIGFADFTLFTDQTSYPWCCGFTPLGSIEQWGENVEGTNLSEKVCDPGQEAIMGSELRLHCAHMAKGNVCTKVKHCEKTDPASEEPSQDHHQPQEAAAALGVQSGEIHFREEDESKTGDSRKEYGRSLNEPEDDRLDGTNSFSSVYQAFSMHNSASEDLGSISNDLSYEGVSADLELNVSSLASQEDQTDWDRTADEDEELENYKHFDSSVSDSMEDLRQSEAEKGSFNQLETQETPATSNLCGVQSHPVENTENQFSDINRSSFECQQDQEHADVWVESLGSLPPSDSFADFCSAPTQEDEDELWAEFNDQKTQEEENTHIQFREEVSRLHTNGDTEEEQDKAGQYGVLRRNSCQASLLYRLQHLLQASFPEATVPAKDNEEELLSLDALFHTQHLPENEKEDKTELGSVQWMQQGLWWPQQDVHSAVGLQFQWGGSHANRTLLRSLGVDTRNIVFIGMKKQPLTVPAFASGLGLLEPTKDSVPAGHSSRHTAVTAQTPSGPQDIPNPSTDSVQEALPLSQLDWRSRGLSSSQDAFLTDCSALNLDYFGPEEESRFSCSGDCSNNPPPGVDPDLYALTIIKVETSANSCHLEDPLSRLMDTAVRFSTGIRKSLQDEELSAEAGAVIDGFPNLSFMKAKVLMFPSILISKECCSE